MKDDAAIARHGSGGLRLHSGDAVLRLRAGVGRLKLRLDRLKALRLLSISACRSTAAHIAARLARIDCVPFLISCTDRIEAGLRWSLRSVRHLLARCDIGLTGAFAWRATAALSGIGLTALLITSLSAKDEDRLMLANLSSAAADFPIHDSTAAHRPRPSATAEDWTTVPRPMTMFSLEAPEFGREPPYLEARRSPDGSRREDLLSFGSLAEPKPHLMLRLATGDGAAAGARSFMVALVHDAARHSLAVGRSSAPIAIETRFGPLETADVVLGDGKESRSCIAFRTAPGEAAFAMSGWWCAAPKPSDHRQLSCLIDRLDLAETGANQGLRSLFARSEPKRRPDCTPPSLAASRRNAPPPDADGYLPTPPMKTASTKPNPRVGEARKARAETVRRQP